MTRQWTRIEDYWVIDIWRVQRVEPAGSDCDCVYPDCLIEVEGQRVCEHACPFEITKRRS